MVIRAGQRFRVGSRLDSDHSLASETREHAQRDAAARAQAEHGRLGGHGTDREQACGFGNFDVAQRFVEDDEIRHLAGGLDDGFEACARGQHTGAGGAQMLLALVARSASASAMSTCGVWPAPVSRVVD